jgi:hypothetical protein
MAERSAKLFFGSGKPDFAAIYISREALAYKADLRAPLLAIAAALTSKCLPIIFLLIYSFFHFNIRL